MGFCFLCVFGRVSGGGDHEKYIFSENQNQDNSDFCGGGVGLSVWVKRPERSYYERS